MKPRTARDLRLLFGELLTHLRTVSEDLPEFLTADGRMRSRLIRNHMRVEHLFVARLDAVVAADAEPEGGA